MSDMIPPRPTDGTALSGAQFMRSVRRLSISQFEDRVFHEIAIGNVPDFMRPENFREMNLSLSVDGRVITATVRVCPDYLAIGSNEDFARVPISPIMAQRIAQRFGFAMPTQRLVDAIDAQAKAASGQLRFVAAGEIAGSVTNPATGKKVSEQWNNKQFGAYEAKWMESYQFAEQQSRLTDAQMSGPRPSFVSGHKKDVVYHPDTQKPILDAQGNFRFPGRVAIYHRGIQPLSTIHHDLYFDYSHGIRFLDGTVRLQIQERDGSVREERMSVRDILMHPQYHQLFSPTTMDIDQLYRRTQTVPRKTGLLEPQVPPRRETERQVVT